MTLTDAQALLILFIVLRAVWCEYFVPQMYFTGTGNPIETEELYTIISITSDGVLKVKI